MIARRSYVIVDPVNTLFKHEQCYVSWISPYVREFYWLCKSERTRDKAIQKGEKSLYV